MYLFMQIIAYTILLFLILYFVLNYIVEGRRSVCIVVLGDIGRSPRMQYHALSFAQEGFNVDLVGYSGSLPHRDVQDCKEIEQHQMRVPPNWFSRLPRLFGYFAKAVWQTCTLSATLLSLPKSKFIMVQNPPSIPTLAVAWFACLVRSSQLVVDWHNYGYTVMGLSLGFRHQLVLFSKWYESCFGGFSSINLCVTQAMKDDLQTNWGIRSVTLYDRPADMFKECSLAEQHGLFWRLGKEYKVFAPETSFSDGSEETEFTLKLGCGTVQSKKIRPALVISSTSWTEDEDFGILLSALQNATLQPLTLPGAEQLVQAYRPKAQQHLLPTDEGGVWRAKLGYDDSASSGKLPDLICVITGRGPLKQYYKRQLEGQQWKCVRVCLPWLTAEDYPRLLGAADIGVCLHRSSSGLDLPMKVVDMFGCGLPVCAIKFHCLPELVDHGKTGLVFGNAEELAEQLKMLLEGFPMTQKKLKEMRRNIKRQHTVRWHDQWKSVALPLFTNVSGMEQEPGQ